MADQDPIIVRAAPVEAPAGNWLPTVGPEGTDFLQSVVPEGSRDSVRDAAVTILAKGTPPHRGKGRKRAWSLATFKVGRRCRLRLSPL